jgi:diadenosine tetraphosphate (Ap4A) HIT family hydrolase
VRPLHTLIIPKRHVADIFEATREEPQAVHESAANARMSILLEDPSVKGFNCGSNIGAAAGQVIFQEAFAKVIFRKGGDRGKHSLRLN